MIQEAIRQILYQELIDLLAKAESEAMGLTPSPRERLRLVARKRLAPDVTLGKGKDGR